MSLTLYAQADDWSTAALTTVARHAGIYVNVVTDYDASDVAALSPGGQVPVLATEQGGVFQVNAIARYLARNGSGNPTYGETDFEGALVDGWLDWGRAKVEGPSTLLVPEAVLLQTDYYVMKTAIETLNEDLKVLNNHVAKNTWLVGRHMSIADIIVALTIKPLFTELFGAKQRKPFNNVLRWLQTVLDQPGIVADCGDDFTLLKKSPVPTTPPKRESKDEVIDVVPDCSYLSEIESTLDLNTWKTKYANADPTRPEATEWFWANFDPKGFTLWFFHYKFFEECTVQFKTNNLFGGFLQRSDAVKAFSRNTCASMCVLEKDSFFHIYGVWMIKGDELPMPWTENIDDVNYYEWTKADPTSEEDRTLVSDYWAWESENNFGGRGEFRAGKTYGL